MMIVLVILLPLIAVFLFRQEGTAPKIAGGVVLFLLAAFLAAGYYMATNPARVLRDAGKRSCYAISNRRLLIQPGSGTQSSSSQRGSGVTVTVNTDQIGVLSYAGLDLLRLNRVDEKNFEGAGELNFGLTLLDEPSGGQMTALDNVATVEKMIRAKLIDPVVDKLLRGEVTLKDGFGRKASEQTNEETTLPPDGNIKTFMAKAGGERRWREHQNVSLRRHGKRPVEGARGPPRKGGSRAFRRRESPVDR